MALGGTAALPGRDMFEVIPAVDLKGGKCVRLQEGVASRSTEYSDDPVAMALHWEEVMKYSHIIDIVVVMFLLAIVGLYVHRHLKKGSVKAM